MSLIWINSTLAMGIATIFYAYYLIKKRKTSAQELRPIENVLNKKFTLNESNAEQYSPDSNCDASIEKKFVKLISVPTPRSRHNSFVQEDLYLSPIDTSKKWEIVGKVERLYIYPIEGGGKLRINQMHCSNIGSSELGYGSLLRDRCFVVYSVNPCSNIKSAVIEDAKLRLLTITQSDNMFFIDAPDIDPRIVLDPCEIFQGDAIEVDYGDGTIINVQDCGDEVSTVLTTIIQNNSDKTPRVLRLGMYVSKPRGLQHHIKGQSLTGKENEEHSLEALSPTYSACTIVNEASVKFLRNESGKLDLTHDYFRPHIVITGQLPKYAEDNIKALRIGQAAFTNKLPCIQNINVNINPNTGISTLEEEPYRSLLKTRPLANSFCKYNSIEPIFGINMKVLCEGKIKEGDHVYVQWDKNSPMEEDI